MNENEESTVGREPGTPVIDGFTVEVVELDLANEGPPIFDVEVSEPAVGRFVYAVVKKPEIRIAGAQQNGKLMPRVVFETKAGAPKKKVRLALLQAGDIIPAKDFVASKYLGAIIHPMTSMPITVYELAFNLEDMIDAAKVDIGAPMLESP